MASFKLFKAVQFADRPEFRRTRQAESGTKPEVYILCIFNIVFNSNMQTPKGSKSSIAQVIPPATPPQHSGVVPDHVPHLSPQLTADRNSCINEAKVTWVPVPSQFVQQQATFNNAGNVHTPQQG